MIVELYEYDSPYMEYLGAGTYIAVFVFPNKTININSIVRAGSQVFNTNKHQTKKAVSGS